MLNSASIRPHDDREESLAMLMAEVLASFGTMQAGPGVLMWMMTLECAQGDSHGLA